MRRVPWTIAQDVRGPGAQKARPRARLGENGRVMRLRRAVRGCGRTIRSLAHLRGEERRLYLAAWWTLLACRLRLRFSGAPARAAAARQQPSRSRPRAAAPRIRSAGSRPCSVALTGISSSPLRVSPGRSPSCASSHRNGVAARLELGLRRDTAGLTGHAWVVHDGEPVNDSSAFVGRYVKLLRAEPSDASGPSAPAPPRG